MGGKQGIELVAFDMFGTLVRNDVSQWVETLGSICKEQQLPLDGKTFHAVWTGYERTFRVRRTNLGKPEDSPHFQTYYEAWRDAFVETFEELGMRGDADAAAARCVEDLRQREAFPDAALAIGALQDKWRLGVLSNADDRFLSGVVERHGWRFQTVVSSEGARAYKPDPRIFTAFCEVAGVDPRQVLYVGDSHYDDVHGAKAVGMRAVWVTREQRTPGRTPPPDDVELLAPDYEVASLDELEVLLSRVMGEG